MIRIRFKVRIRVGIRVVRLYDEYHITAMHARMMCIITQNERPYCSKMD